METDFYKSEICKSKQFCQICRSKDRGRDWRLIQTRRFPTLLDVDFPCITNNYQWGGLINGEVEINQIPTQTQSITDEMWEKVRLFFENTDNGFGKIQWKIVDDYIKNPNSHSCQCKKWKNELLDYAIKNGFENKN